MTDTVVIGMGNPLMSDEGIGIRVLEQLQDRGLPPGIEPMDLGTSGLAVVHAIAGRRKAVIIDCACMGTDPGTLRRFTPDDVRTIKAQTRLSLHEGDLMQALTTSRALGECPEQVVIFGIEPADLCPGEKLSPALNARVGMYADAVAGELEAGHA